MIDAAGNAGAPASQALARSLGLVELGAQLEPA